MGGTDFVLNVLLFLPLGFGLGLMGARRSRAIGGVIAATVVIEVLQIFILGRDPSVGDVLANSLGGTLAFALAVHRAHLVRPSAPLERRLLAIWSAVWLAVMVISAYALVPSPTRSKYYGLIARDLGPNLPPFAGKVLRPRIDTITITDWEMPEPEVHALLVRRGGTAVRATLVPAACPTGAIAGVLQIADARQREIVLLGQAGRALVFRVRTGASALRLRPMYYALDGAFSDAQCRARGDTLRVEADYARTRVVLRAEDAGGTSLAISLSTTVMDGWRLFTPGQTFVRADGAGGLVGALWLFSLSFPFGYLGAASPGGSRGTRIISLCAVLGAGLFAVPALYGIASSGLAEIVTVFAAVVIGAAVRTYASSGRFGRALDPDRSGRY